MIEHGTHKLQRKDGQWFKATLYISSRKGTKSPSSWYFRVNGRWVTSYELKLRWCAPSIADSLKFIYGAQSLKDLLYDKNPFLALIKKADGFQGKAFPIPVITD